MSATATTTAKKQMITTTTSTVNGLKLLEACRFDFRLAAAIIVTRPDSEQEELLSRIPAPDLRRNTAHAVYQIRSALGLEADHALEIYSDVE